MFAQFISGFGLRRKMSVRDQERNNAITRISGKSPPLPGNRRMLIAILFDEFIKEERIMRRLLAIMWLSVVAMALAGCGHGLSGAYSIPDHPNIRITFSFNGTYTTDVYGDKRNGVYTLYKDGKTVSLTPKSKYNISTSEAIESIFNKNQPFEGVAKKAFDNVTSITLEDKGDSFYIPPLKFIKE